MNQIGGRWRSQLQIIVLNGFAEFKISFFSEKIFSHRAPSFLIVLHRGFNLLELVNAVYILAKSECLKKPQFDIDDQVHSLEASIMKQKVFLTLKSGQDEKSFEVRSGLGLQAVCAKHHTSIEFDCREADCGICIFRVLEGEQHLNPPDLAEKDFLTAMRADPGERLACQVRIFGDVKIETDYL